MAHCFGFSKAHFRVVLVSAIVLFALLSPSAAATPKPSAAAAATPSSAPSSAAAAPAPGPTSDGTSIDQGIAYVLMLVALVLTYLIHPLDASASYNFF
ncbi:arabinogalactan protein 16-like [Pyrus x bretschneideri]|uniref:arabinogalactan protein 16-like n=1 Tax=Pyrus x bretschneideri TaxID=225117 RepID=UPI00202F7018|nr:arabinogalactan protein 16-like [Pyrus x bretschneideri]